MGGTQRSAVVGQRPLERAPQAARAALGGTRGRALLSLSPKHLQKELLAWRKRVTTKGFSGGGEGDHYLELWSMCLSVVNFIICELDFNKPDILKNQLSNQKTSFPLDQKSM